MGLLRFASGYDVECSVVGSLGLAPTVPDVATVGLADDRIKKRWRKGGASVASARSAGTNSD
jgi:hypothetical protein